MKPRFSRQREIGMTLFEVGVVLAAVLLLAALFLPRILQPRRIHSGINCVNNLKQIGLAYRIWEGDNGDIYPMGISVTNGGSMEMVMTGDVVQTFQAMSNELATPKILLCPDDAGRTYSTATSSSWVTAFGGLTNSNISYLVGVDVTNEMHPQVILSGDCHFEIAGKPVKSGLVCFWTNDPMAWTAARHKGSGNIGLADGSVESPIYLRRFFQQTGVATNRLAIP